MYLEFIRFGGLSKVDHRKAMKEDTFHSPPVRKGVYAFIYPYIEDFLWVWKLEYVRNDKHVTKKRKEHDFNDVYKKEYKRLRKKFKYKGLIWTHFVTEARVHGLGLKYKKEWVQIHTDDLPFLLKKDKHNTTKEAEGKHIMIDPYKRGLGGYYSMDHLEVFIEKVN